MRYSVAIATLVDQIARKHLLRGDGQEDLCFGLWHPSQGSGRFSGVITEMVLPQPSERQVHGNASFLPAYVERVAALAAGKKAGIAFLHSHLGPGWQGMSNDDIIAEKRLAPVAQGASALPLIGLTLGTDGAWSARFWEKRAPREYERRWCESVRVVGDALRVTYYDTLMPVPKLGTELTRTISAWGERKQSDLARLHVGVVGAGSVGCLVAEALARMGVRRVMLIDFDAVEQVNLDRLLHATKMDIGKAKVAVLAKALEKSATAPDFSVLPLEYSVVEEAGFRAALDCDLLFSCVDRPWGRFALNLIANAHLIPVVDGGVGIRTRADGTLRHCTIRAHAAAPGRRCLECLGQYKAEFVAVERDGLLDNPKYIQGLPTGHPLKQRENVFGFSCMAASLEVMQMLSMVIAPSGMANPGAQCYHFVTGTLDKEEKTECEETCYFRSVLALGDHAGVSAIGKHGLAEQARAGRSTSRGWRAKLNGLIQRLTRIRGAS